LVYEAQLWNVLTDREKKYVMNYAKNYNNSIVKTVQALVETIKDEKSKPIIKESRLATIKRDTERFKAIYLQNNTSQAFANWWYENKLMGYTHQTTLMEIFKEKIDSLESINQIKGYPAKTKVDFIGIVDEAGKTSKSKTGTPYAKFSISDETGIMKVMIFGVSEKQKNSGKTDYRDKLQECKDLNNGLPKEGDIVIVKGTKMEDDTVFADLVASQQNKIYTKLSELKESE
jgi:DNA polymerase III alpha subunit